MLPARAVQILLFNQILRPDIDEDQRPRDMVLGMEPLPVRPRPFPDKIEQEHIDEHEHMIPDAVLSVYVDIIGRIVPDLDNGQRSQHIRNKCRQRDKSVFKTVKELIVPSDDINEDQVIDQFHIFDLLLTGCLLVHGVFLSCFLYFRTYFIESAVTEQGESVVR